MNTNKRLESLDAFRGFDMMWIMGASSIVVAICSLFPGGENSFLVQQMSHVKWHGLAFMDLIFPTFLFISGISFPFSLAKQKSLGHSSSQIHLKIFKRGLLLVLLGLLYNGLLSDFTLANIRFCSVLGRIGLAWMFAALFFVHFSKGVRAAICAFLLIGYYLLLRLCLAPGAPAGADPFSFEWNIVGWIDSHIIPGRLYRGTFDPEGLMGVIPACATAMLGMFTGEFIKDSKLKGEKKSLYMFLTSLGLLALGLLWNIFFPINKNLWSSSFVCVVGAYSLCLFSLFYYVIDVKGHRRWAFPFKVIGMNSITIYMAMDFINFGFTARALLSGTMALLPAPWADLLLYLGIFLLRWAFLYFLYKKKIFLKV
ncbi:MAG: acyltransferase family protein [Candidatus Cryptobacteroides sp.]